MANLRINSPSGIKLGALLLALAIGAGLSSAGCSGKRSEAPAGDERTAEQSKPPAQPNAPEKAPQAEESLPKKPGSTLEIGAPRHDPGQVISIPLEFTSGPREKVGLIQAQLEVKEGPWKFQKARVPEGSQVKISAKPGRAPDTAAGSFIIQVEISSGSKELGDGVAGYLSFSTSAGTPTEIPITVTKLETYPPESDSEQPERRSGGAPELPSTPDSDTPSPGCFFFTH